MLLLAGTRFCNLVQWMPARPGQMFHNLRSTCLPTNRKESRFEKFVNPTHWISLRQVLTSGKHPSNERKQQKKNAVNEKYRNQKVAKSICYINHVLPVVLVRFISSIGCQGWRWWWYLLFAPPRVESFLLTGIEQHNANGRRVEIVSVDRRRDKRKDKRTDIKTSTERDSAADSQQQDKRIARWTTDSWRRWRLVQSSLSKLLSPSENDENKHANTMLSIHLLGRGRQTN